MQVSFKGFCSLLVLLYGSNVFAMNNSSIADFSNPQQGITAEIKLPNNSTKSSQQNKVKTNTQKYRCKLPENSSIVCDSLVRLKEIDGVFDRSIYAYLDQECGEDIAKVWQKYGENTREEDGYLVWEINEDSLKKVYHSENGVFVNSPEGGSFGDGEAFQVASVIQKYRVSEKHDENN